MMNLMFRQKTKLLTSKNWLQTKREIGPEGGPFDDITFTIEECDLDNLCDSGRLVNMKIKLAMIYVMDLKKFNLETGRGRRMKIRSM